MATVQISAFQPGIAWHWGGTTATLRYTYTSDFVDSTGTPILHGLYKDVPCTIAVGVLSVPSHTIISTLDALVNPLVTLNAQFIDERGAKRSWLFQNYSVPTTTPTTMGALQIFNQGSSLVLPPDTYLNSQQVQNLINIALGTLNDASNVVKGRTFLDVAPAVASAPTAVGNNSPVIAAFTLHASKYASFNLAVAAINALGGGTVVVDSASPVTTNISVPFTVVTQFQGQGQLTGSSKTVTFVGPLIAPPVQIFASGVTAAFTGNPTQWEYWTEWFGGGVGLAAATNAVAFQACSDAVVTRGSGTIFFGSGQYDFNAKWSVGVPAGAFTGINLKGTNGLVGTRLNYTGATNTAAIEIARGRSNRIDDILLTSGVAHGSTIGLHFTGAASGTQTTGCTITNVTIREFHIGAQAGGPGSTAASELTFIACYFSENDIGFASTASGNTLNILFLNCSAGLNDTLGYDLGAGSGVVHIIGGAIQSNGIFNDLTTGDIRMSLGWNGTVNIQNVRFEPGDGGSSTGGGGVFNAASMGIVKVASCEWSAGGTITYPFFRGLGAWTIDSCTFGADAQDGWVLYNADNAGSGSFTVTNSQIQNTNTRTVPGGGNNTTMLGIQFDPTVGGSWGLKIKAENNFYTNTGAVTKFDSIDAIIASTSIFTGKVYANRRVDSFGNVSSDIYDWDNQDATPSVKWANVFKTGNTSDTHYTTFDDPVENKTILVFVNDTHSFFDNGATLVTRTGATVTGTNGFTYSFTYLSSKWRQN